MTTLPVLLTTAAILLVIALLLIIAMSWRDHSTVIKATTGRVFFLLLRIVCVAPTALLFLAVGSIYLIIGLVGLIARVVSNKIPRSIKFTVKYED